MTWSDEELVTRSIGGDADSFNQLVLRWERPIYALAYRVIGREEDARDVCQETFLRAFRALNGFRGQAKFSSWLYRIALNLCRDWVRRERRTPIVQALAIVAGLLIGMYLLFVKLLHVPWPPSLLGDLFPALRDALGQLI